MGYNGNRIEGKMINFTKRLDKAIRTAAWAHEQEKQHRKGTDIPYIIHPFSVMLIVGKITDDEDTLIACLMHDILEDVSDDIYNEIKMRDDFGDRVVSIVKDLTNDKTILDWHERSKAYINHVENFACDEAVMICVSDKIHNLLSILIDYEEYGDKLWSRFTTKNSDDQLWWYESILTMVKRRNVAKDLSDKLSQQIDELKIKLNSEK